jgi:alpha-glucosidase
LDVYYKEGKEKSVVYEDGQDGYDYKKGDIAFVISSDWKGKSNYPTAKEGKFNTPIQNIKSISGLPFKIKQ